MAKAGSVTGAAKALSISQPAVSQAIRQLENHLGTELFYRVSRGVKLTREGQLLFSYVEKGYEQIALGQEKVLQPKNMESGEIRIGASDMIVQFALRFNRIIPKRQFCLVRSTKIPMPVAADRLWKDVTKGTEV